MSILLQRTDLYFNGRCLNISNGIQIVDREVRQYVQSPNDRTHEVRQGDTLLILAYRYYGSSKLWHYIADINEVFNPFNELTPGSELLIPDIDRY